MKKVLLQNLGKKWLKKYKMNLKLKIRAKIKKFKKFKKK